MLWRKNRVRRRNSLRLKNFDYGANGAYFVTICTRSRLPLFGEVIESRVQLNGYGVAAAECWKAIPDHFPSVQLDEFAVMPDHVHGILVVEGVGATRTSSLRTGANQRAPGPQRRSLGAMVGSFKSAVTGVSTVCVGWNTCPCGSGITTSISLETRGS